MRFRHFKIYLRVLYEHWPIDQISRAHRRSRLHLPTKCNQYVAHRLHNTKSPLPLYSVLHVNCLLFGALKCAVSRIMKILKFDWSTAKCSAWSHLSIQTYNMFMTQPLKWQFKLANLFLKSNTRPNNTRFSQEIV